MAKEQLWTKAFYVEKNDRATGHDKTNVSVPAEQKKNKSSTIEVGTKVRSSLWHTADTSPDTLNTKDNTKQVMNIELAHILGWHQSRGSGKKKHFIYFFNVINTRAPAAAIYIKKIVIFTSTQNKSFLQTGVGNCKLIHVDKE